MTSHAIGSYCEGDAGQCRMTAQTSSQSAKLKPIEIYVFIDPACPQCWALEPILKKLHTEYSNYIKMRYLIGKQSDIQTSMERPKVTTAKWERTVNTHGMPCDEDILNEQPLISSHDASLAIKAAELQGKQAGLAFLRRLREAFFIHKQDMVSADVLMTCAQEAHLDLTEFEHDCHANTSQKSLHCDIKMAQEMEVTQLPTVVLLNNNMEEDGVKMTGYYSYDIFENVIADMLDHQIEPQRPPSLEAFLQKHSCVATREIALVYNLSEIEAEKYLKELLLCQKVEKIPVKHGVFWHASENIS